MPKSNFELLQEAIENGDKALAQQLMAKIGKAGKITKPKTCAKLSESKKAARKPAKASKSVGGKSTTVRPKRASDDLSESSYIAPSRVPGTDDGFGGRKFIGPDGKEHTYSKRVSMSGQKFVNKFNPSMYGEKLPPKHEKLDKKLKNISVVPRPGQRGADRDIAHKIDVRCCICHDVVKVYPWEAETVDGESSFRCSKKSCIKAR